MNQPVLQFKVSRPSAPEDNHIADVLLRFTVPLPVNPPPRPAINLALVLDRSGSMAGPALQLAKKAAQHAVRQLGPQDRVSVMAFDSTTDVLVTPTAVAQPEMVAQAIEAIRAGNSTALHAGWLAGVQQVSDQPPRLCP